MWAVLAGVVTGGVLTFIGITIGYEMAKPRTEHHAKNHDHV